MKPVLLALLWCGCAQSTSPFERSTGFDAASGPPADLSVSGRDLTPLADAASSVNPNDQDGDGYLGGVDCDDHDADVHPGAPEVCNGKDDDCDGFVDDNALDATTFYPDADHDGLGNSQTPVRSCTQPPGWVTTPGDCDDQDPTVGAPTGGTEFCIADVGPQAVFVSTTHGNDGNTGASPVEAVKTIGVGVTRALKCVGSPCALVIAAGEYVETVAVTAGVNFFGGYSDDFMSRDTSNNLTRISSNQPVTVSADNLAVATKLDGLTILGADLSSKSDSSSSVALRVSSCAGTLTLATVNVVGGLGAGGPKGDDGAAVTCNARGGQGGTAFDCGASTGADGDADGDAKSGGGGGPGGDSNCPDACPLVGGDGISGGTSGKPGGDGAAGDPGTAATDGLGSFGGASPIWTGASGSDGKRGRHGTGGGGGGSGGTKRFRACFGCGTLLGGRGGDGAPGGCAGGGGKAGGFGGAVFSILLVNSTITLKDTQVTGGVGGHGGPGGAGSDGQSGSSSVGTGHQDGGSQKCGVINYDSGGGGIGGVGGHGGAGGGGAGGVGGASVAIARVGASQAMRVGSAVVTAGMGGKGGGGGASSGNHGAPGSDGQPADEQAF